MYEINKTKTNLKNFLHELVYKKYSKELLEIHPHNKENHDIEKTEYKWYNYVTEECMECVTCDISVGEKINTQFEGHTTQQDFNKELLTDCLYLLYHHFELDYSIIGESSSLHEEKVLNLQIKDRENWIDSILKIIK